MQTAAKDTVYGTALFYHAERGNVEAVTALLQHHADKSIRCTKDKLTAVQIATKNKHDDIVDLLTADELNRCPNIQGLRLTDRMRSSYDVDFSKIPIHPMSLRDEIVVEENIADEVCNTSGIFKGC